MATESADISPGDDAASELDAPDPYTASIEAWGRERDARLAAPNGWLTIVSLDWLEPGINRIGTTKDCTVRFPGGSAPDFVGSLRLEEGAGGVDQGGDGGSPGGVVSLWFEAAPGSQVTRDGEPIESCALESDAGGAATELQAGRVTFWVIERNGRFAVRARDPESPLRTSFEGVERFGIDPSYRVFGTLHRYEEPRSLLVPNMLGHTDTTACHGELRFRLHETDLRLFPIFETAEDSSLFVVFKDDTTERETYGGGRFLVALVLPDGRVEIDFNKAYNPPCALNPNTTCPLPPAENTLPLAIRAGEKSPHQTDHGATGR